MNPRVDLGGITTKCQRPNCTTGSGTLHRHHRRCEHMFVKHFAARQGTRAYDAFVARYYEFRPEDIVMLCDECHFEVHLIYGPTIRRSIQKLGKVMAQWSWPEARILMRDLGRLCDSWLARPTDYTVQSAQLASGLLHLGLRRVPFMPNTESHYATLQRLSRAG